MPRLTNAQLRRRLLLDWKAMKAISGPLISFRATASPDARVSIESEKAGSRATYYIVTFHARSLKGRGRYLNECSVAFDLLAGGNYPWSEPGVHQRSRPLLFSPHVSPKTGWICTGPLWTRAEGQLLLAHLVIHVLAAIVNSDRPAVRHGGLNPDADRYWHDSLRCRPITPDLQYPSIPSELTHGIPSHRRLVVLSTQSNPKLRIVSRHPGAPSSP